MKESFLHYIWQFQYFNKEVLKTSQGNNLKIFTTGTLNANAGPDFQSAKIKIDDMEWAGNIEIHVKASEWNEHQHFTDQAYNNVILHVVWINDKPVLRSDGTLIPTLELKGRVDESLVHSYKKLMESGSRVACHKFLPLVDRLLFVSMLDAALVQRLESKADVAVELLKRNNNDWEQTAFEMLAKNFGFKLNSEPFQHLARSIPYKILLKHSNSITQVEALLFGQAGFLEIEVGDDYYQLLRREYKILKAKYSLDSTVKQSQWQLLRLRPANFPTVRIAQFATLMVSVKNIFSVLIESKTSQHLKQMFSIRQSDYWQAHYQFNKKSKTAIAGVGELSIDNIIINTVAPLLVAYAKSHTYPELIETAIQLLQQLAPENNAIIRTWNEWKVKPTSAYDSQALIELHNNYCLPKRCLDCRIGAAIIRPN